MTDLRQAPPAVPDAAAPVSAGRNPAARSLARMNIMQMTLAVVLAVFLWQWFDSHRQIADMRQELARRLAEVEGDNKASQALMKQEQETIRELSAREALLEARYAESQSQRIALESLYQKLSGSRDETTLSEVEQLLLIAGQQLQLSANVKAALIAMQQADEYLARLNHSNLTGLRQIIDRDIDKLRALPALNIPDINFRIDKLIAQIDTLPLSQEIRTLQGRNPPSSAPPNETAGKKVLQEIWDDARSLFRIENMQQQKLPLIPPTQSFFLRENLKLRLLTARLALLEHDEASFKHDLQSAKSWVEMYFDPTTADSKSAIATLQQLIKSDIRIELPDISDSLEAVRSFRLSHSSALP